MRVHIIAVLLLFGTNSYAQVKFDYILEWTDSCSLMTFSMNSFDLDPYFPYPKKAIENLIQGTSVVMFNLDETCHNYNEKIINGIDAQLDSLSLEILEDFESDLRSKRDRCCPVLTIGFPIRFTLR